MKKLAVLIVLGAVLAGGAFADHPKGLGIGLVGGFTGGWNGGSYPGVGLSLKVPSLPVFWGIHAAFGSNHFGASVTGDYYFIDKPLLPEVGLHWYLGLGGFFNFYNYSEKYYGISSSYMRFSLGGRLPLGLSWQPLDFLELFLNIAPSLGIGFDTDGTYTYNNVKTTWHDGGIQFPSGGWGGDFGIRFWI